MAERRESLPGEYRLGDAPARENPTPSCNNYIKQAIEKGYALYVYDFKFDDLSVIAYNHLRKNLKAYGATPPKFYVINFDDPRRSHRCNPLAPNLMSDITDAYEASYVIMLNLNRRGYRSREISSSNRRSCCSRRSSGS